MIEALKPYAQLMNQEIQLALQGIEPTNEKINFDLAAALKIYAQTANINQFFESRRILDLPDTIQRTFSLIPHLVKNGRYFEAHHGCSYIDGEYGLTLYGSTTTNTSIPLATASFSRIRDLHKTHTLFSDSIQNYGLLICQLQQYIYYPHYHASHQEAKDILHKYRWEQATVAVILDFAHTQHIPVVYGQPPEYNYWLNGSSEEKQKTSHLRYNVTYQEMHFKKEKHGLWVYPLSYGKGRGEEV